MSYYPVGPYYMPYGPYDPFYRRRPYQPYYYYPGYYAGYPHYNVIDSQIASVDQSIVNLGYQNAISQISNLNQVRTGRGLWLI